MDKKNKIPSVEEMKEKARKWAENIPNLKEKQNFMTRTRGFVIEFSLMIEQCFNQLITETGKEIVFDSEGLHLIKGIRKKKDLQKFKTKSEDMIKLIEQKFPKLDAPTKAKLNDSLKRFEGIRNLFAHVPIQWESPRLKFENNILYKRYFKLESKWEDVLFALNEFMQLHQWIVEIILIYNKQILLTKELLSQLFLGKAQSEIQKEIKDEKKK